jgi:hypothetical protein
MWVTVASRSLGIVLTAVSGGGSAERWTEACLFPRRLRVVAGCVVPLASHTLWACRAAGSALGRKDGVVLRERGR